MVVTSREWAAVSSVREPWDFSTGERFPEPPLPLSSQAWRASFLSEALSSWTLCACVN